VARNGYKRVETSENINTQDSGGGGVTWKIVMGPTTVDGAYPSGAKFTSIPKERQWSEARVTALRLNYPRNLCNMWMGWFLGVLGVVMQGLLDFWVGPL